MPAFLAELAINALLAAGANAGVALTIGAFVANYALLIGGLALSASQAKNAKRKARSQFNAAQVDRLMSVSTTTAPRELVMGRVRKGGSVFFRGSNIDLPVPPPTGDALEKFILRRAPRDWLKIREDVADPMVDTSLAHLLPLLGVEQTGSIANDPLTVEVVVDMVQT